MLSFILFHARPLGARPLGARPLGAFSPVTGAGAAVRGYRVAGKTGTARIVGPQGYDDERHVAWFAGLVPVSQPRFVMVVVVNEPQSGVSGGGAVAAPIFARIAQKSLLLLGVAPDQQVASAAPVHGAST